MSLTSGKLFDDSLHTPVVRSGTYLRLLKTTETLKNTIFNYHLEGKKCFVFRFGDDLGFIKNPDELVFDTSLRLMQMNKLVSRYFFHNTNEQHLLALKARINRHFKYQNPVFIRDEFDLWVSKLPLYISNPLDKKTSLIAITSMEFLEQNPTILSTFSQLGFEIILIKESATQYDDKKLLSFNYYATTPAKHSEFIMRYNIDLEDNQNSPVGDRKALGFKLY